jgi:uncharacterized membrane protein
MMMNNESGLAFIVIGLLAITIGVGLMIYGYIIDRGYIAHGVGLILIGCVHLYIGRKRWRKEWH